MPFPTFIIGGAQKCGTSTLRALLQQHEDVFMAYAKNGTGEIQFFNDPINFQKGPEWYKSHFSMGEDHKQVGEKSALYLMEPDVPERITNLIPDVKLIFIFRDPVDRAYSAYWHEVRNRRETLPFDSAIKNETERIKTSFQAHRDFSYIHGGFYASQLKNFFKFLTRNRILCLNFKELKADPQKVASDCFRFLGLSDRTIIPERKNETTLTHNSLIVKLVKNPVTSVLFHKEQESSNGKAGMLRKFKKSFLKLAKNERYEPLAETRYLELWDIFSSEMTEFNKLTGIEFKPKY